MLQSCQNNLFTSLLNLASEKYFIKNRINLIPKYQLVSTVRTNPKSLKPKSERYLVKVEHQIQLAHVPEKLIQNLDKEVNCLQIC